MSKGDKPPIIVRFINRKSKVNILKNGRKLKGTNVYVNIHLSRKNADIAGFARQLKRRQHLHSTWKTFKVRLIHQLADPWMNAHQAVAPPPLVRVRSEYTLRDTLAGHPLVRIEG